MSVTEISVVQLAIGAAILAVLYGAFMSKWIINLPAVSYTHLTLPTKA